MTIDKLSIANEMQEFDRKNRDFYDNLSEEEKKKFSPFLMIRWGSSVNGSPDLQAYYLISANEKLNKNTPCLFRIVELRKFIKRDEASIICIKNVIRHKCDIFWEHKYQLWCQEQWLGSNDLEAMKKVTKYHLIKKIILAEF